MTCKMRSDLAVNSITDFCIFLQPSWLEYVLPTNNDPSVAVWIHSNIFIFINCVSMFDLNAIKSWNVWLQSKISGCKSDSVLCLVTAEVMVVVAITAVALLLLAVVGASLQGWHDIEPCSWPLLRWMLTWPAVSQSPTVYHLTSQVWMI